jgi:hypothetical protein
MTSCDPPLDQKVSIEAEDPAKLGLKVSEIVILPPDAIVAPLLGNQVAAKALSIGTGYSVVETFLYSGSPVNRSPHSTAQPNNQILIYPL